MCVCVRRGGGLYTPKNQIKNRQDRQLVGDRYSRQRLLGPVILQTYQRRTKKIPVSLFPEPRAEQ